MHASVSTRVHYYCCWTQARTFEHTDFGTDGETKHKHSTSIEITTIITVKLKQINKVIGFNTKQFLLAPFRDASQSQI